MPSLWTSPEPLPERHHSGLPTETPASELLLGPPRGVPLFLIHLQAPKEPATTHEHRPSQTAKSRTQSQPGFCHKLRQDSCPSLAPGVHEMMSGQESWFSHILFRHYRAVSSDKIVLGSQSVKRIPLKMYCGKWVRTRTFGPPAHRPVAVHVPHWQFRMAEVGVCL